MTNRNILIVFLKHPEPGKVKTRLAADIGKRRAAMLYRVFVETVLERTESKSFSRIIFYTPSSKKKQLTRWLGPAVEYCPQQGRDLGERMLNAFRYAFAQGADKTVIIGTDSPTLDNRTILNAFRKLNQADAVIGPSTDGGYYLLGMKKLHRQLFMGMAWSTGKVLERTLSVLKKSGLTHSCLRKVFDVDTLEDLVTLERRLQKPGGGAHLAPLRRTVREALGKTRRSPSP